MLVVRAWPSPEHAPADRPRVVDGWPRVIVNDHDYSGLAALREDVISLDWDIAVSREDLAAFARRAEADPGRVRVAPFPLYNAGDPVWSAERYNPGEQSVRRVSEGDASCHLFGFGMVYLPHALVAAYLAACPAPMYDMNFSGWHYRAVRREVPVDWAVRPVHLHYPVPSGGRI